MNKPIEDMNEEEKLKMREYEFREQKLNEEKEKMRKNLENELKKLRSDIVDIYQNFDEKLLVLFKKKLEYDLRILENQLYIIRLLLSTLQRNEAIQKLKENDVQMQELLEKEASLKTFMNAFEEYKIEVEQTKKKKGEEFTKALDMREEKLKNEKFSTIKNIYLYAFEKSMKDEKKKKRNR